MSCRFIYTQTCTTTPPWKVFGAPSNSTSSIAETLPATARHALKSSTTLNAFITASAPTARSATFPQLTSNSKTTNQMTRFYCPFFQSKPMIPELRTYQISKHVRMQNYQESGLAWDKVSLAIHHSKSHK